MRASILFLIPLLGAVSCLSITAKLKDGYDSVYVYYQNVTTHVDGKLQSEVLTHLHLFLRPGTEKETVVGRLQNLLVIPENVTAEDLSLIKEIESPFKIVFTADGKQSQIFTKKDEHKHALKTKDSVLKLLLQNVTQIDEYLLRSEKSLHDEDCQSFVHVEKKENEYVFETETKLHDCNNQTTLQGYVSDQSEFRLFYHLDAEDKKLIKAKSIIDLTYLTSVRARINTVQDMEFVRFDGLKEDIDENVLTEAHTSEQIDELWKQ
ncbi:uncharacterized protein LOC134832270 [Culicoides brevitarsis]|uniref:uncharacterized protein LOC134832270 n=1 Tax=Culicoides brevitarsis TaxID=469753 RepID=UPI00307BCAA5